MAPSSRAPLTDGRSGARYRCGEVRHPRRWGASVPCTRVFIPSMVDIPVWMNSSGDARAYGLIAAPVISRRFSGTISGPPSMGFPPPGEDPAEHLLADRHLDRLAGEPDAGVPSDPGRGLEDLDHHELVARVEHLSPLYRAVIEHDIHEFAVADRLGLLHKDERPGDLGDCPVFLHVDPALSALNSLSMSSRILSSTGL